MLFLSNKNRICAVFDSFCKTVSRSFVRNLERVESNQDNTVAEWISKIGGNMNQIVTNNNSHLYRESGRINLIKYMEKINGLIKELVMVVMTGQPAEVKKVSPWTSGRPFVFVYPTYAWQMPRILRDFIRQTAFTGNKCAYFITTCGGSMGNMLKYLAELCEQKTFTYMGCAQVIMPENYIAMFNVPEKPEAVKIIKNADVVIRNIVDVIRHNGTIPEKKASAFAKASSGMINTLFYPMCVSAKKFYATDACIGCGKCTEVCPLNNISLKDRKPVWGDRCTHCMACICKCPEEAIEYGNKSQGKPRYQCPL